MVNQKPRTKDRLVVFVGPHKSASSTVQEFLVQYATGRPRYRKLKAFQEWRWPVVKSSLVPARKQWARLAFEDKENSSNASFKQGLREALNEAFEKVSKVAVGSEEFDRFGAVPWSGRDGTAAIQEIIDWSFPVSHVDVVVNFRSPRSAQWISIWKQLMSLDELVGEVSSVSYPEWICNDGHDPLGAAKIWEYLDCVANPLGLALHLLETLPSIVKVWLIDMGGVSYQGLDIAHVSACHVLGLPCKDGWVRGINRTLVVNPKFRPNQGISSSQLDDMEWLLRQRDCTFKPMLEEFQRRQRLEIIYPRDLSWNLCQTRPGGFLDMRNTTFLLQAMQSQFGCQSDHAVNLSGMVDSHQGLVSSNYSPSSTYRAVHDDIFWIQLLQWFVVSILFGGSLHFRRRRR